MKKIFTHKFIRQNFDCGSDKIDENTFYTYKFIKRISEKIDETKYSHT